jgi:hypothetical protein
MLPFIEHGFECGDRAFYVVDPKHREKNRRQLEAAGIDVVATRDLYTQQFPGIAAAGKCRIETN